MSRPNIKSVDLFAGIGGIRTGFDQAFGKRNRTVFVSEQDPYAQQTYYRNYGDKITINGDITKIREQDIPPFDLCLAGFPCQPFSAAGNRQGMNDDYHGVCRGTLFMDVVRICAYHKPKVIFCENVKNLLYINRQDHGQTFAIIIKTFQSIGYKVFWKVLNSKDFGLAQNRERLYIVCYRNDVAPDDFEWPTGKDSTSCMRDILDENAVDNRFYIPEQYLTTMMERKRRNRAKNNGYGPQIRDLDGVSAAFIKGGMGLERNLFIDDRFGIPKTYNGKKLNKFGIRRLTPTECARLQGFPENFVIHESLTHAYEQFGNSVSVPVIKEIALAIKKTRVL